ncbi:short chain dehydrogenase/reductase family oxidoreductase [Colletotrichum graminicola]|uniref:Short chain dehydrogenase/reductase family oxidoreductase n=1 Tax=Colletotrichum graminicola (strain M1.001 / M2 / FGSC 10212) TaxID=645133 RepID=E3QYY0_COLGM|nr:short chain dehydrogenase/reductase family oxidoreductase [Colletotrichum graminicola M1.001]EFQ36068.1 short chain dehydrogenase/reductase family oxidoreductase [Colletotrichum graminicola M1.001]WDK14762.1 short chain dehydrogenase/reductase family oxidoreductase [Colletotrichum graminicola]
MASTVYVITGTNKGIGLGLLKALLARPSTTIVASVRNEEAAASLRSAIADVARGNDTELHIMLLDFTKAPTPAAVIEAFKRATLGTIDRVDVLISNAASPFPMTPTHATSAEDLRSAFEINTIAPLMVFQGLWPLMEKSRGPGNVSAKFIGITSSVGSIGSQELFPAGAYGPSKAALNWLIMSLHVQHESLISLAIHPGWVQTYMGNYAAKEWNYEAGPPDTIDSSVNGVLAVMDGATRETTSGKFVTQTGQVLPW